MSYNILSPSELRTVMHIHFPANATSWAQATDEVRDACRMARIALGRPENEAIDFRLLETSPSNWNTQGINGIVSYYEQMNDDQKRAYLDELLVHFPTIFASVVIL